MQIERYVVSVDLEFANKSFKVIAESHKEAQEYVKNKYGLYVYQIISSKSTTTNEICANIIDEIDRFGYVD